MTDIAAWIAALGIAWQVPPLRWIVVAFVVLIVCFYVVMAYKVRRERRGHLHWYEWVVVLPFFVIGYPTDVVLNYTVLSAVFGEWPQPGNYTITARITRYRKRGTAWSDSAWPLRLLRRWTVAVIAAVANRIDPGHIPS